MREPGRAWDGSRRMREQDGWDAHAAFMDGLAEEGFVVLGGPVGEAGDRFMHVVAADSAEEVERRLAADPWRATGQLIERSIDPWRILLRAP